MDYVIFVFGLFTFAFLVCLYQVVGTLKKKGFKEVGSYTVNLLFIFLFLALWKIPEVFDTALPYAIDLSFFGVFLVLGIWAGLRLSQKLKVKPAFKVYKRDLFVVVFSTLAVISTFPF